MKQRSLINRQALIGLVIAIVIIALGIGSYALNRANSAPALATATTAVSAVEAQQATIRVSGQNYPVTITADMTVLAALKATKGLTIETKTFTGIGDYVSAINGVSEGDGKYWLYSINGQEATEGVGAAKIKAGDTIEFNLKS